MLLAPTREQVQLVSHYLGLSSRAPMPYVKMFENSNMPLISKAKNISIKDLFEQLQEAGLVPHGVKVPTITANDVQVLEIIPGVIGASKPLEAEEAYANIASVGSPSEDPKNVMDVVIEEKLTAIKNAVDRTRENVAKGVFLDGTYTNATSGITYDLGLNAVVNSSVSTGGVLSFVANKVETFVNTYARDVIIAVGKDLFAEIKKEINSAAGKKNERRGDYTTRMENGVMYLVIEDMGLQIIQLPTTAGVTTYDNRLHIISIDNMVNTYGALPFRGQDNRSGLLASEVYVDVEYNNSKQTPEDLLFARSAYVPAVIDPNLYERYNVTVS